MIVRFMYYSFLDVCGSAAGPHGLDDALVCGLLDLRSRQRWHFRLSQTLLCRRPKRTHAPRDGPHQRQQCHPHAVPHIPGELSSFFDGLWFPEMFYFAYIYFLVLLFGISGPLLACHAHHGRCVRAHQLHVFHRVPLHHRLGGWPAVAQVQGARAGTTN